MEKKNKDNSSLKELFLYSGLAICITVVNVVVSTFLFF